MNKARKAEEAAMKWYLVSLGGTRCVVRAANPRLATLAAGIHTQYKGGCFHEDAGMEHCRLYAEAEHLTPIGSVFPLDDAMRTVYVLAR